MALFEALAELVGTAGLSLAPALDAKLQLGDVEQAKAFVHWLGSAGDSEALETVVDGLAREIWISDETRGVAQAALERHAIAVASLIRLAPPSVAVLSESIRQVRAAETEASGEPAARRIAASIMGEASRFGASELSGLTGGIASFLVERAYAHLLRDAESIARFEAGLRAFAASQAPGGVIPAAPGESGLLASLPAAVAGMIGEAGGPLYLVGLREQFGLNEKAVSRVLALLVSQGVPADRMLERLEGLCKWLGDAKAQLSRPSNDLAETRRLKARAAAALGEGDFEAAADALRQIRRDIRESRRRTEERLAEEVAAIRGQMAEEARATARLAELALANRDFAAAADLFGEATLALPSADRAMAWKYNLQRAEALYQRAAQSRGSQAVADAISAYSTAVRQASDLPEQKGLGEASIGLADALALAGVRDGGTARLKDAVAAYRRGLSLLDKRSSPNTWSAAQLKLAQALAQIGERDQSSLVLREAADAFRDVMETLTAPRHAADRLAALTGLGNVLLALEERDGGEELLVEASEAFQRVIELLPEGDPAGQTAQMQMNLGTALLGLGDRPDGIGRLEAAVVAFKAALQSTVREMASGRWALLQLNLGNAYAALGQKSADALGNLDKATAAYEAALGVFSRETDAMKWAITQMNLGSALVRIGELRDKRRNWVAAAGALVPALEVFEVQGAAEYAEVARHNLRRLHESWDALLSPPGATAPAGPAPKAPISRAG